MNHRARPLLALFVLVAAFPSVGHAAEAPYSGAACAAPPDPFFLNEVWAKVGALTCLECHKAGGDAEDSKFVLTDPAKLHGHEQDEALRRNRDAFARIAAVKEKDGQPRVLQKVVGKLKHGGKEVLKPDSAGYQVLATFVERVQNPSMATTRAAALAAEDKNAPPFFDGVAMLDDRRLLRRVTLSLASRLPTDDELAAVDRGGRDALNKALDDLMTEEAFYARLREAFNDIFLTLGVEGPDANVLSYDHFNKSRLWYQKHDLSAAGDAKAQQQARYKLADDYRKALLEEPMRLVDHIVRNDRPFTELVTADYIMVSPYTARGYGIYEDVKGKFKNPDDPFEFVPVRLPKLVGRERSQDQDSPTGFYPHAGVLSTFQYLARYPTTETNRNRLRSRMYYLHFLGVDILEQAARVSDAAEVTAKFANPTMEASQCVVCHKTLDPVGGLFQDYWRFAEMGVYGKRKGGWFKDQFPPGFEGEDLPEGERWRALQWLGERTAKDPRFAATMVEHAYYVLTGRRTLAMPKDIDDPMFASRLRAYREQRKVVDAIAARFARGGFNLKSVFKDWVVSDFYRADGMVTAAADPKRRAELDDVGLMRMLSPEQLDRKVGAVFGQPWGRMNKELSMLYGGIDSKEVTERATDPSGAMGAIQRILANDVACRNTALDFSRDPADRKLFAAVEPDVVPGKSPEADGKIRTAIVRLHRQVLGRHDAPDSAEVDRTYRLFAAVVADAAKTKTAEKQEVYSCRQGLLKPVPDPYYAVRAWRAVLTYLLRRPEFLYE
ncbi:MAG TPA: DUF1592 domain-containing protein [Humisphaera sp.]